MKSQRLLLKTTTLGLAASLFAAGCGGDDGPLLGTVAGRITLDDQPLANAVVKFQPVDTEGTYSAGRTDEDGYYHLRYTRDRNGAMVGAHRVSVSTAAPDAEDELGNPRPVPERIPVQYNVESTLIHEVAAGNNDINIDLSGAGRIAGAPHARR